MADGHFPTLVSATRDANTATNPLFTSLTDGTTAATFTGSSLNVNITGGASSATEYAEDSASTNGDLGTQALAVRQDTLATSTDADGDYTPLKTNAAGALYVSVSGTVTVTGTVAVSSVAGNVTVVQPTGSSLHVVTDSGSTTAVTGNVTVVQPTGSNLHVVVDSGAITVSATDLDIRDLTLAQDAVKVSANSTANSATNPIFVKQVDTVVSTEVHSYNTAASVAADASSNHDYTVVGTTFLLRSIKFATSGGGKVEIQTGPVASLATLAVGFIPKEGGICQIDFNPPKEVPVTSTGTVRVIRTNRQGQAQDVYSTIIGNDIP